MWPHNSKKSENSEDEVEKYIEGIYVEFEKNIKNRKEAGQKYHKPDFIPIALFYVAKSQKESAEIQKKLNNLTTWLVCLTILLIILTAVLIFRG